MSILLHDFTPESYKLYVHPSFAISFKIVSDGDPIDLSTVDVTLSETDFTSPAIDDGVGQDGYNVSISATEVDGDAGYEILITPSSVYKDMSVAVTITADTDPTSGGETFVQYFYTATHLGYINSIETLYAIPVDDVVGEEHDGMVFNGRQNNILFQLGDKTEPTITRREPVPNSVDNPRTTDITFGLHDNGQEGIAITSLDVYINGTQAIMGGAFMAGWSGSVVTAYIDGFEAYTVFINNPYSFPFNSTISVRVVVTDLVADITARNELDTTYVFQIVNYDDYDGPSSEPTLPPTGLGLDACIEFDWLDAPFGDGPEWDTLNVTLRRELTTECITSIQDDVAVINGVAAPGYTLYAYDIEIGYQIGYHVIICPEIPFNELEIITVIITGDDSQGNPGESQFSVSTQETTPPDILNILPEPYSTGIDHETSITFDMHDSAGTGVDVNMLQVKIDDGEAVINGVAQTGYGLSYEADSITDQFGFQYDGYHFTVTRDQAFTPGKAISVEIDGYDGYGNMAFELFDFTTAPDTTPPRFEFIPECGEENVSRDVFITVDVRDALGVDRDSVNITIQESPAVSGGIGVSPFDVYISEIETSPGVVDGYRFIIDTEFDFGFEETVTVFVSGKDIFDNYASQTSTFITYKDTTPPTITSIFPRDGQEEVSLRPDIGFTVRDGYDIDFDRLNVSVNGDAAVIDGVPTRWYNLNYTRIEGGTPGVAPGDGYNYVVSPKKDFDYNATVNVAIMAFDASQGNKAYEEVSWYTVSPNPPRFDMVPTAGSTVDVDTNIWFEIFDDGYNIDINSLNVFIDEVPMILNNVVQSPDYEGSVTTVDGYHYYMGVINPRFLLAPEYNHTLTINAREDVSGNLGQLSYQFTTGGAPNNPKTIYIGDQDGVQSIVVNDISGSSVPTTLVDGYHVYDVCTKSLKYINRLAIATRDSGAILYSTNYSMNSMHYSVGDEIIKVQLTTNHNGTLYLLNKSRERIDVYYNILYDDVGRSTPDVYYGTDGYALSGIDDGYFTDMVVTEGTSTVKDGSNSIFLGTSTGAFRIETEESVPGSTEIAGQVTSYGIANSSRDYKILDGTTNYVVALDVNTRLNHLYVATRSESSDDDNAITYIDLSNNSYDGSIPEERLIHRLINDISFKD